MLKKLFTALSILILMTSCSNYQNNNLNSLKKMPKLDVSFIPDEITLDQDKIESYSYTPYVYDGMPKVYINTEDKNNSFATKYTLGNKLLDEIEYVDATVSTDDCSKDMVLTDVEASVKVRGNFTLNYDKKPLRIKFSEKQNMLGLHNGENLKTGYY